jgi:hypothetical protein
MKRVLLALVSFAVALHAARPTAAEPPCEFENVERVVAVGDVHGAYDRFIEILRAAAVVDARGRWAGGKTHLVQTGDVVDRGPDSRKVLDLLQQLERDAPRSGGRVHALIGNHEAMRLIGDARYIVPGEYAAFKTSDSEDLRTQIVESLPADVRAQVMRETPLGRIEMLRAFAEEGAYGKFLRRLNAVVRINGVLFMHGGISLPVAPLTCADINARVRRELSIDLEATKKAPEATLAAGEDGPLWYRGLASEPDSFAPTLDEILKAQHASAIVVGHTVRTDGRIAVRFGGRVLVIDTGMQPAYVPGGAASALELRGGTLTAIYTNRKEVVGHVTATTR